jgi:DNA-binding beta-propeller fold protein YncE
MKQIVLSLFAISILLLPSIAFAQEPTTQIIDVGNSALHVKIVSDLAYVTNPADEQIIVIDTTNNQIIDTFEVGSPVIMLEPVPDQNRLYVTADGEAKI